MYNFSSSIFLELPSPCAPVARETCGFKRFLRCERTPHARDILAIVATTANTQKCAFVVAWLAALLRQGALCIPLHCRRRRRRRPWRKIFSLKWWPTSRIWHKNKNRMRRHTIFRNYCRYYGCYYYRMTTVVRTVDARHGITTSLYHRRLLSFKSDLGPRNGFLAFSQKITHFWKNW